MSLPTIAPTSPAWTQFLNGTNPLSLSDADLSSLMVMLMNCMKQYTNGSQGGNIYSAAKAFFSDVNNMPGTREAIQRYGLQPCQNTAGNIYVIYKASVYFNLYPLPAQDPANCNMILTYINAVTAEQTSVQKSYTNGLLSSDSEKYTMIPLNDRLSDLNSMYAGLNCDVNIQAQTTQTDLATVQQANATSAAGGTTNQYLMWGIYGAAGLILIAGIYMLFKPSKK